MEKTPIKTSRGYTGTLTAIVYDKENKIWVGKCILMGCTYSNRYTHDIIPLSDITPNP